MKVASSVVNGDISAILDGSFILGHASRRQVNKEDQLRGLCSRSGTKNIHWDIGIELSRVKVIQAEKIRDIGNEDPTHEVCMEAKPHARERIQRKE